MEEQRERERVTDRQRDIRDVETKIKRGGENRDRNTNTIETKIQRDRKLERCNERGRETEEREREKRHRDRNVKNHSNRDTKRQKALDMH